MFVLPPVVEKACCVHDGRFFSFALELQMNKASKKQRAGIVS